MARRSKALLGHPQTPFGVCHLRIERAPRGDDRYLAGIGPTLALRWLFPTKPIASDQTRVRIVPSPALTTDEDIHQLYAELVELWDSKHGPEAPSPVLVHECATVPPQSHITLDSLIKEAEAEARATLRTSSLAAYQFEWKAVCKLIPGSTPVTAVTRSVIVAALQQDRASGAKPETLRKHATSLKRLLARAVRQQILPIHPMDGLRLPKTVRGQAKFLTANERERLLDAARSNGRHLEMLVALGVYLGLRKAELLAIRWQDLDFQTSVAHVRNTEEFQTKNGKDRTVPMCSALVTILQPYRQLAGYVLEPRKLNLKGGRYRWDFRDRFARAVLRADLNPKDITPHTLRHTFASLSAQAGMSLFKIGQWMGHSTTEVTEIYAHLAAFDTDIERLSTPMAPNTALAT